MPTDFIKMFLMVSPVFLLFLMVNKRNGRASRANRAEAFGKPNCANPYEMIDGDIIPQPAQIIETYGPSITRVFGTERSGRVAKTT